MPTPEPIKDDEKLCGACFNVKPITDFYPFERGYKGVLNNCKPCVLECNKAYRATEAAKKKAKSRKKFYFKRNYVKNLPRTKAYAAKYRSSESNKLKRRAYENTYKRNRKASDVGYKIQIVLRQRIISALKMQCGHKAKRSAELLGCSVPDFKIYIESKFEPGMSWANWGKGPDKWEIDHILPCAIFDLTRSEHQVRCFHFSNMQPLWALDNQRKGAKILMPARYDS